ncbi:ABC transporter ATP-binding protein [Alkalilimnicola sp. S0819]|uniref:ABC transporter ATP-binding protein n=1 Tax=Alkalilimnicola sp. S0819 TaxID=2613922 RepID=UPI001261A425|nr:ABC transporter ATP-binding protein [Alkalilimnicola sp. S0819]KAB7627663.1 ABC transporter ATP-binding protein [Alkalilimnicola sp. S0819]MPQ15830.1 ATP-binding cassette domain-containing protein [Alkalilimnicola sp. S0819]
MAEDSRRVVLETEALGMVFQGPGGEIRLFDGLDLSICSGESLAILGASGSGKSTLLGLLAGLDLPSHGRVSLLGTDLTALGEDARARLRGQSLGFVFQAFHLLAGLTARENVMLPLELAGEDGAGARAEAALTQVGLEHRLGHYPRQLSGGEQQRVAIARAFVAKPALLLADEPTGNLDEETGHRVADLLFHLNRESGTTLVMVTHDPQLASRCDRVLRLEHGRLVAA